MFQIVFAKSAQKDLEDLPKTEIQKILSKIEKLSSHPYPHGYTKIKGHSNLFRIRVGNYRVVYSVYKEEVIIDIVRISHRKDVYRIF